MSSRNKGKLKVRGRKYTFGCQFIKFEKRCFDWVCAGHEVTDVDDGYEVTETRIKHKHHIVKTVWFKRPYDYKKNFLFGLTEFFSNIFSFFRVLALNLLIPAVIVAVIVGFVTGGDAIPLMAYIYGGVYGGTIGGSLLFALLGLMWRKVFKLREKTDEIQLAAGYQRWSDYDDDNSTDYYYE